MQLEISKCYFSYNFQWSASKLYENIGYQDKSKCLLEYCNEKLASSTEVNILYLKLSKHYCVRGLRVKQIPKAVGVLFVNIGPYGSKSVKLHLL